MTRKRIGAISLVLVLALGGLGVGYAQWTENLTIEATVETAEINWEFVYPPTTNDPGTQDDWLCPGGLDDAKVSLGQHVGSATATLVDSDEDGDKDTCKLTLSNTYPGYYGRVSLTVHNNGELKLKILAPTLTAPALTNLSQPSAGYWKSDQIECRFLNNVGNIVDVNGSKALTFELHVLDLAAEGATYEFTLTTTGEQYTP